MGWCEYRTRTSQPLDHTLRTIDLLHKEHVVWCTGILPLPQSKGYARATGKMSWTMLLRKWRRDAPDNTFTGSGNS